jgi:hypothetical protein
MSLNKSSQVEPSSASIPNGPIGTKKRRWRFRRVIPRHGHADSSMAPRQNFPESCIQPPFFMWTTPACGMGAIHFSGDGEEIGHMGADEPSGWCSCWYSRSEFRCFGAFFCWSVAVFVAVSSCATWVKNDTWRTKQTGVELTKDYW